MMKGEEKGRNKDAVLFLVKRMLTKRTRSWRFSFPQSQTVILSCCREEHLQFDLACQNEESAPPEMMLRRCCSCITAPEHMQREGREVWSIKHRFDCWVCY